MNNIIVKIKNLSKHGLPEQFTNNDAGFDLRANLDNPVKIMPLQRELIATGIYLELPQNYEAQVRPRSGLAVKNGISIVNSPGTIDCFSEDSVIKTTNGDKLVKNLSLNDIVLSVNDNMEIEEDSVSVIIDKGLEDIISIETNNGVLKITKNTIVYTKDGAKLAKDITMDDEIFCF